jgi:hypothetical protein
MSESLLCTQDIRYWLKGRESGGPKLLSMVRMRHHGNRASGNGNGGRQWYRSETILAGIVQRVVEKLIELIIRVEVI